MEALRRQRRWTVPQPTQPLMVPTYLIDGDCGFCRRAMARVLAHFPDTFAAVPYADADLDGLGLSRAQCAEQGHFLAPRDERVVISSGSQSWAALLQEQSGAWRLLGGLMTIPPMKWCADLVYIAVAANRGRLVRWP